jgi:sporulation protein YlmC with PRC-barrel domain
MGNTSNMRFVGTAFVAGTIGVLFLLAQGGWILAGTERSVQPENANPRTSRNMSVRYDHFRAFAGMVVENVDGEKIGTIKDLIVEVHSGRPEYVILRSGGFMGRGRLIIVPISAIAMRTTKVGIAAIDITRRQWKHAPEFSKKDLPLLGQTTKAREIALFYEQSPRVANITGEQRNRLRSTGRAGEDQTNSPTEYGRFRLGNDLVGNEVLGRQHVRIGEITDLLVDFTATRPAYAIVAANRISAVGGRFAVPLQLLRLMPGQKVLVKAEPQDFEHAKPFRPSDSQNSDGSEGNEIYRYER